METIAISTILAAGPNRQMIASARDHDIVMDVRKEWGGDNAGPTPPELMAIALGGCVFNICRIMVQQRQIVLDDLRVSVSGEIDPTRAFGLETNARAGFSEMRVEVTLAPALSAEAKADFHGELMARCPLCDTIENSTPLQITMAE
ncbi:MAG: OsmC family protein [Pseudomonadota bacterium]